MKKLVMIACTILCAASANALTYEWTDSSGVVHFTDSPETIPPAYRHLVIKKDDITMRDPKIREEVKRDEEQTRREGAVVPRVYRSEPEPEVVAPTPAVIPPVPEVTPPEPKWNLCAPGQLINIPCARAPVKKKGVNG